MVTSNITASYSYYMYDADASYTVANENTTAQVVASDQIDIAQQGTTPYYVRRGYLLFDTSTIPSGAVITSVTLKLCTQYDGSTRDFNMRVINANGQVSPGTPPVAGDYDRTKYTLDGSKTVGTLATSSIQPADSYNNISLNTDSINKGSWTKFLLISDRDIAKTSPTSTSEFIRFYNISATNKEPKLTIEYNLPSASGKKIVVAT